MSPLQDLIPWNRNRNALVSERTPNPFLALHREMNRLFEEAFEHLATPSFGERRWHDGLTTWPHLDVSEASDEFEVSVELPGLDAKDVSVEWSNGVLTIKGEKHAETDDANRRLSECFYGRFARQIALEGVDADKLAATFKNGVLAVVLPKTAAARSDVKRIAINAGAQRIEHKKAA